MKLNLDNLDITSFPTTAAPVAPLALSTGGEDCFSWQRICPTHPITWAAAE